MEIREMNLKSIAGLASKTRALKKILFLNLFLFSLANLWSLEIGKVPVYVNGKYPIYGEFKVDLIEKTLIDGEKCPDEYLLGIYDIAIDSQENIYIVTFRKVLKFDKTGRFLKQFCERKGEGPGELQDDPIRLFVDKEDNLFITDTIKIIQFNSKNRFIKNIKIFGVWDFVLSPGGYIFCVKRTYKNNIKNKFIVLRQFNNGGKIVNEFLSHPDQSRVTLGRTTIGCEHYYTPYIYFCSNNSGGIVFGYSSNYILYNTDSNGKIIYTVRVDLKKREVKSNEISAIKSTLKFKVNDKRYYRHIPIPEFRPFYNKILCDEKGRIYVVRIQPVLFKKKYEILDVFSNKGKFLYQIHLPYIPEIIRNGKIYFIDNSDIDDTKLKTLITKNYQKMKF